MVWAHKGRMHWVSSDMPKVLLDVIKTDDGKWLFTAISAVAGTILSQSTHSHPLDAMSAAKQFMEAIDGIKEETSRSKDATSARQASSAL